MMFWGNSTTKVRLYCGGAGITPFISIFVTCIIKLIEGNSLITATKNLKDVIMEDELQEMLKDSFIKLFTCFGFRGGELTAPTLLIIYPTLDSVLYRSSWLRKKYFKDLHDGCSYGLLSSKCK
jgi:ferredoxin-NADP reductase